MHKKLIRVHDELLTLDRRMIDASAAFLIGELERLDPTIHEPLMSQTWSRDVPVRPDVTIGDEVSSFIRSDFGSPGHQSANGKHFVWNETTQISGTQEGLTLERNPLVPWAIEVKYSIFDLEKSQRLNRPIDQQKIKNVQRVYQSELDEVAYVGDSMLKVPGLLNSSEVPVIAASGAWTPATSEDVILDDINTLLLETLESSNETLAAYRILMPWKNYSMIATRKVSSAADKTILTYVKENNISNDISGVDLQIFGCKWCAGAGASGNNRMMAYTPEEEYVRMPAPPIMRTPLQEDGLFFKFYYYTVMGGVEFVYPETVNYMDGI